jgi:hypothetical protein
MFSGIALMAEARALGVPANRLPIIADKHCCGNCVLWLGRTPDKQHGWCDLHQRATRSHYDCSEWEKDNLIGSSLETRIEEILGIHDHRFKIDK